MIEHTVMKVGGMYFPVLSCALGLGMSEDLVQGMKVVSTGVDDGSILESGATIWVFAPLRSELVAEQTASEIAQMVAQSLVGGRLDA